MSSELEVRAGNGDFEWYRQHYDEFSFQDLKKINEIWTKLFPDQFHYKVGLPWFTRWIGAADPCGRIVELGGFTGGLAAAMFEKYPKLSWMNIEVCSHAPVEGLKGFDYREHVLSDHVWVEKPDISDRTVFVTSNTLEHFSDLDCTRILGWIAENRIGCVILNMPIQPFGQDDWKGYYGSHILHLGSNSIKATMDALGYMTSNEAYNGNWYGLFTRRDVLDNNHWVAPPDLHRFTP